MESASESSQQPKFLTNLHSDRYIYPFACHENDRELCNMEFRALFGQTPGVYPYIDSNVAIAPERSPFISMRIDVLFTGVELEDIVAQAGGIQLEGHTFKVLYIKHGLKRSYGEQRQLERQVGARIRGTAEMRTPDFTFGLLSLEEGWLLGVCRMADPAWQGHKHKPQNYSTGLSAALARSLVNIAVPDPAGIRAIDPCCGMGNVLIEALSMGIDIRGRDLNPLAVKGARENLAYFGYDASSLVTFGDMRDVSDHYDAAILDMPYNLCSVLPQEVKQSMLAGLRGFSDRAVIISTEEIEEDILAYGFRIMDYGRAAKGSFIRKIWVCQG